MLYYPNKSVALAFDDVTLTNNFTGNEFEMATGEMSKLSMYVDAVASMQLKVEVSMDGMDWYSLVIDETQTTSEITSRVWEFPNAGKYNILLDVIYPFIKVSVKGTGKATVTLAAHGV